MDFSSSRQRRLNSDVADATWKVNFAHRGLKSTAKFNRRAATKNLINYRYNIGEVFI